MRLRLVQRIAPKRAVEIRVRVAHARSERRSWSRRARAGTIFLCAICVSSVPCIAVSVGVVPVCAGVDEPGVGPAGWGGRDGLVFAWWLGGSGAGDAHGRGDDGAREGDEDLSGGGVECGAVCEGFAGGVADECLFKVKYQVE